MFCIGLVLAQNIYGLKNVQFLIYGLARNMVCILAWVSCLIQLAAYKHDQKEKRDAAADRKKKQGPTPGPTGPDQANPLPLVPGTATIPSVIPPMCIDAQAPLDIFGSSGPPSEELMDLEHSLNIPPHPLELI